MSPWAITGIIDRPRTIAAVNINQRSSSDLLPEQTFF
jgi:hypothetical protein